VNCDQKCLDPGRHGVDLLRSCYRTKVRTFYDSDEESDLEWFWVDDDKMITFPTRFGSHNWDHFKGPWEGVGEVYGAKREWTPGVRPPFTPTEIRGTPTDFAKGISQRTCPCIGPPRAVLNFDLAHVIGFTQPRAPIERTFSVTEGVDTLNGTLTHLALERVAIDGANTFVGCAFALLQGWVTPPNIDSIWSEFTECDFAGYVRFAVSSLTWVELTSNSGIVQFNDATFTAGAIATPQTAIGYAVIDESNPLDIKVLVASALPSGPFTFSAILDELILASQIDILFP